LVVFLWVCVGVGVVKLGTGTTQFFLGFDPATRRDIESLVEVQGPVDYMGPSDKSKLNNLEEQRAQKKGERKARGGDAGNSLTKGGQFHVTD